MNCAELFIAIYHQFWDTMCMHLVVDFENKLKNLGEYKYRFF